MQLTSILLNIIKYMFINSATVSEIPVTTSPNGTRLMCSHILCCLAVLIPDNGASREEACLLAMATCQVRCQTGFVTSPKDDCTFCVCREDVLQASK